MRLFFLIIIMCSPILLQGCLGATIIGSSAAIVTKSTIDPRSIGRQVDDGTLEARVKTAINKDKEITCNTRIIITAYAGKILLIGQSPNLLLAKRAKDIAINVKGVQAVYNQIRQTIPIDFNAAYKDAWITTKIKSKIFINNSLKSLTIKVITENKEVFLLGILTQQEGNVIAKIASKTSGVKHVITVFTYLK
ncbi:MAG: division/outer membrane stress-associated lipid-binding lipoprotein [Arsenophonus sp. ET-DL9-MAG3]